MHFKSQLLIKAGRGLTRFFALTEALGMPLWLALCQTQCIWCTGHRNGATSCQLNKQDMIGNRPVNVGTRGRLSSDRHGCWTTQVTDTEGGALPTRSGHWSPASCVLPLVQQHEKKMYQQTVYKEGGLKMAEETEKLNISLYEKSQRLFSN